MELLLKYLRFLLFPLAFLYGIIIWMRNVIFNLNIIKSVTFNFPVFCVGNITVGGTGKTPVAEYLTELLMSEFKVAFLSRGYKRQTKGFILADDDSLPDIIGDEPFQIKSKYPGIKVGVDEKRVNGIRQIIKNFPKLSSPNKDLINLPEAFFERCFLYHPLAPDNIV